MENSVNEQNENGVVRCYCKMNMYIIIYHKWFAKMKTGQGRNNWLFRMKNVVFS